MEIPAGILEAKRLKLTIMALNVKPVGKETLHGKRVSLEVASPQHAEFLAKTYQLDDFMDRYRLAQDRSITADSVYDRLSQEKQLSPQQLKRIEWVIMGPDKSSPDNTADKYSPIGIASLADYQPAHNRAELLVGISDPQNRVGNLAVEATLLVMEFAFHKANLHKLTCFVYGFNEIAQKNVLHLGFQQEACLREHYYNHRSDKYIDLYQNGLLKKEFFSNAKLSKWSKRLLGRDITMQQAAPSVNQLPLGDAKTALEKALSRP